VAVRPPRAAVPARSAMSARQGAAPVTIDKARSTPACATVGRASEPREVCSCASAGESFARYLGIFSPRSPKHPSRERQRGRHGRRREGGAGAGRFEISAIPGGGMFFTEGMDDSETDFGNYALGTSAAYHVNRWLAVEVKSGAAHAVVVHRRAPTARASRVRSASGCRAHVGTESKSTPVHPFEQRSPEFVARAALKPDHVVVPRQRRAVRPSAPRTPRAQIRQRRPYRLQILVGSRDDRTHTSPHC